MNILNKLIAIIITVIIFHFIFRYIDFINQKSFKTTSEWWYLNAHITADDGSNYGIYIWQPREDFLLFSISDELNEKYYFAKVSGYELQFELNKVNLSLGPNYWIQSKNDPFNFNIHIEYNQTFMDFYLENEKRPLEVCGADLRPFKINEKDRYCSLTRLGIQGDLTIDGNSKYVNGIAWVDHQKLIQRFEGWEWFGIQLNNSIDLRVAKILFNNSIVYGGAVIDEIGNLVERIYNGSVEKIYISGNHQVGWHIALPEHEINLSIQPTFKNQRFNKSFWEMDCRANGSFKGIPVTGLCYAEIV